MPHVTKQYQLMMAKEIFLILKVIMKGNPHIVTHRRNIFAQNGAPNLGVLDGRSRMSTMKGGDYSSTRELSTHHNSHPLAEIWELMLSYLLRCAWTTSDSFI